MRLKNLNCESTVQYLDLFIRRVEAVGDVMVFIDCGGHAGGSLLLIVVQRFLSVVSEGTRSRAGLVPQHHYLPPRLLLRRMLRCQTLS